MKYTIWRGNTTHTEEILKYKDTYVIDGWYLCILRELVDGQDDLYYVLQNISQENIYLLTGVTSPVFLKGVLADSDYSLLHIHSFYKERLDMQWDDWKEKYLGK